MQRSSANPAAWTASRQVPSTDDHDRPIEVHISVAWLPSIDADHSIPYAVLALAIPPYRSRLFAHLQFLTLHATTSSSVLQTQRCHSLDSAAIHALGQECSLIHGFCARRLSA